MRRLSLAIFLLSGLTVSSSYGQVAEFSISGGKSLISDKDLGSGYSLDDGFSLAFRLTLNNWVFFGHEFGYAYNRSQLVTQGTGAGMAIHQGFYNFLAYAVPEGKRIRPFVTGGGHFSNFVPPGQSAAQGGGSNKFGFNYGGGLKLRVAEKWQVRGDFRQYVTGKPFGNYFPVSGSLKQNVISIGVGFVL
jgi:opacity protein-like surface antigen